jgi:chorismate mutase
MGGLQDDAAASGERMKAQMSDLSVTVGTMLLPIMSKSLDVIGPLIQKFADAPPHIQEVVVVIGVLAAAMGPALGILGKFTGAFGTMIDLAPKVISGLGNLATAAIANAAAIGAATIAVLGLVLAYQELQKIRSEVDKKDKEVRDLIDKRADAMLNATKYQRDFNKELKEHAIRTKNLKNVIEGNLGALQLTEGFTGLLSAAQGELAYSTNLAYQAILANTIGVGEANEAIALWNETLGEGGAQIALLSQEAHDSMFSLQDHADAAKAISDTYIDQLEPAAQDTANAVKNVGMSLEETTGPMGRVNQSAIEATEVWGGASGELDKFREKQALLAASGELQVQAMDAVSQAVGRATQAYKDAQNEQANLISSMQDATKEAFKQKLLMEIDPGEVGVEAWAALGMELGLLDQKAVDLANSIGPLTQAWKDGAVPTDKMNELLGDVYNTAGKLGPEVDTLGQLIEKYTDYTGPAGDATLDYDQKMTSLAEETLPRAIKGMESFYGTMQHLPDHMSDAVESTGQVNEKIVEHKEELAELAQDQLPKAGEAVGDFTDEMDDMLDRYEQMPEKIKPANEKIIEHKEEMMELSQETIPKTITSWDRMVRDWEEFPARMRPTEEMLGNLNNVIQEIEGDHYSRIHVTTIYKTEGGGEEYQKGGIVPGAIGVPRQVTVHGGEIILNPYQVGALGGPGGPPPPSNVSTSYGGDTFNVEINDRLSGAMFMNELDSRGRYERLNARM